MMGWWWLDVWVWLVTSISPSTFWSAVSALAAIGTLVVVLVAAINALAQIKETVRSRNAALFSEISRRWDEDALVQSRHHASEFSPKGLAKRIQDIEKSGDFDEQQLLFRMPNFFEDLAVLELDGDIPISMIREVARWDPGDTVGALGKGYCLHAWRPEV